MKATLFAVILLLFVVSFSAQADEKNVEQRASPPIAQTIDKINLNKADVSTLTNSFKGIGKKRAEAIVKYREEHGDFKSIDDLAQVRGMGKAFVNSHLAQLQEVFAVE